MTKILLTGASGFIGQRVACILKQRHMSYSTFDGDLTDFTAFSYAEKYDIIIHLAALITHKGDESDIDRFREVNVKGTGFLMTAYPRANLILISTKDVERKTLAAYSQSKLEAENHVLKEEKNKVIRLPSVFGPGTKQKKLIPLLIREYAEGIPCVINNNDMREYLYVKECAELIIDCIYAEARLIRLEGTKIRNLDLKKLIESVFKSGSKISPLPEYQKLFEQLSETVSEEFPSLLKGHIL